jgi:hypothetical protein
LKEVIKSVKLEAHISHTQGLVYECLYRKILRFTVWGPPCVEDQPHITPGLSFLLWESTLGYWRYLAFIRARELVSWPL